MARMRSTGRIAVLTNPVAGRGRARAARDVACARFAAAGWEVEAFEGADADHALELARAAVHAGVAALVVVGGDGLVNLGLQVVATTGVPLGIVACGTGNDVARYVDLSRKDALAAADRIVAALTTGRTRRLDLACVQGRYFATVLCAGFDAVVNERANAMRWPRGQMRYNLATLAELRTFEPLRYTLELDGVTRSLSAMMVSVGNGPSFGGGLRIAEGADLTDGLLDVVIIKPIGKADLVRTYPRLFSGTHTTHPAYEHHRVGRVSVAASGVVAYADGERFGPLPLTVESVPAAVEVLS